MGSNHKVVGTLQLSFPDDTLLDRERFAVWVGYGQKVASTLEREQEIDERKIREIILERWNEILRRPIDLTEDRYEWCSRYLGEVRQLLGADYTHMRLLKDDQFHLVGSAPERGLSELRRLTRPKTTAGHAGACSQEILQAGGIVTNAGDRTAEVHRGLDAIENAAQYGTALRHEFAKIRSTAVLPLFDQNRLIGTWVVDSSQEFFFTERRLRIVEAVRDFLATMVRVIEGDYYRAVLGDYLRRLKDASANGQTAEHEPSKHWLERVLGLLCEITGADCARCSHGTRHQRNSSFRQTTTGIRP